MSFCGRRDGKVCYHGILPCLTWCESGRICRALFRAPSSPWGRNSSRPGAVRSGLCWKGLPSEQSIPGPQPSPPGVRTYEEWWTWLMHHLLQEACPGKADEVLPGPLYGDLSLITCHVIRTSSFSSLRPILCYIPPPSTVQAHSTQDRNFLDKPTNSCLITLPSRHASNSFQVCVLKPS